MSKTKTAQTNHKHMQNLVRVLQDKVREVEGSSQHARKTNVRALIQHLADNGAEPFELSSLAGDQLYPDLKTPGAGIICTIVSVNQTPCMVIANNPCVKAGAYFPITVKKHLRALEIALNLKLPCIYLVDSAGAFLPMQDEVFPDQGHFGRLFYLQAQLSAAGLTQIAIVLGSCTAGGAYIPAMSDHTIMLKTQGHIFLAGPPLVKAATGETVSADALGGAHTHSTQSGLADHVADDATHACQLARDLLQHLKHPKLPQSQAQRRTEEIYAHISQDLRYPHETSAIINTLVDPNTTLWFKPSYGPNLNCGFANIDGHPVGIIANQGILDSAAALKGAHFIQLCDKQHLPLIFLQNISGFWVGKVAEENGIAKHGAKMVMALANARTPKLTVITGGSYGAGNYAMCGRAYDPEFLWLWPNARTAVMGGDQAAQVLQSLQKNKTPHTPNPLQAQVAQQQYEVIANRYHQQSSPYYSTARLWDDGIIDPAHTRQVLSTALALIARAQTHPASPNNLGVMRQ